MMSTKRGLIFVVLALFLTLFSSLALAEDCLLYAAGGESRYCVPATPELLAYCDREAGCDPAIHLARGSGCAQLEVCQEVTCNTLGNGCEANVPQGYCEAQDDSIIVDDSQYDQWCRVGCCKSTNLPSGANFCAYELNFHQCQVEVARRGLDVQ